MGIRIHKRLGYGLTNVKAKDYTILDKRFNLQDGYFSNRDDEDTYSIEGFTQHLEAAYERDKKKQGSSMLAFDVHELKDRKGTKRYVSLCDLICHEGEFGLPRVVMFSCLNKGWSRWDDIIDYVEETEKGQKNKVKVLNRPIYPHEFWMHKDTGEQNFEFEGKTQPYHYIRRAIEMGWDKYDWDKLKEVAGIGSLEEAKEKVVPGVPEFIVELCKYLKVFNDEKTVYTLKPMIYTYWS